MISGARAAGLAGGLLALAAGQPAGVAALLVACGAVAIGAARIPVWTSAVLALLAVGVAWPDPSRDLALACGLGWLAAHRALAARGWDRGTPLVTGLMVVVGLSRAPAPLVWLAGGVWAATLPIALVTGVGRARPAWVGWAAAGLTGTCLSYLALPRLQDGAVVRDAPPVTGFAPEVVLGRAEGPVDEEEVMLTVRPAEPGALYLRGMVLDRFDGRRWTTAIDPSPASSPGGVASRRLSIEATRPESVAFTAGDLRSVHATAPLMRTPSGTWMFADPVGAWAVEAEPPLHLGVRTTAVPPRDLDLALPAGMDPRIRAFGRDLGGGRAAVGAALRRLSAWRYTREPTRVTADPLATFLFERRAGHCEHFASALAVILREAGLPTRVITGYATGEVDDGAWVVRRRNAHAWVEVWVEGAWESVDATPGPLGPVATLPRLDPRWAIDRWSDWDRAAWAGFVARVWPGAVVGLLAALLLATAPRVARAPADPVERSHWRVRRRLAAQGWNVPRSLPPVAAARWVSERADDRDAGEALVGLAWLLYHRRWGGLDPVAAAPEAAALGERAGRIGPPRAQRTTTP